MRYTTILAVKNEIAENYRIQNRKISFIDALLALEKKGQLLQEKPIRKYRQGENDKSCFEDKMLNNLIQVDILLDNSSRRKINENVVIPYDRDVFAFQHLPFVNDGIHSHNYFEINYVYRGECIQTITGEKRTLHEGEISIISPYTQHNVSVDTDSFIISIMVRQSTFDAIFGFLKAKQDLLSMFFRNTLYETVQSNYILFHTDNNGEIQQIMERTVEEANNEDNYSSICCNCMVQLLFCTLLRHYSDTILYYGYNGQKRNDMDFTMILEYINQHYQTITLEYLADFFHYSEAYLSKLFKRNLNENYSELIMGIRMRHAMEFLADSSMSISEISEKVGYGSVDYFTKAFRKKFDLTPSECRKKLLVKGMEGRQKKTD